MKNKIYDYYLQFINGENFISLTKRMEKGKNNINKILNL